MPQMHFTAPECQYETAGRQAPLSPYQTSFAPLFISFIAEQQSHQSEVAAPVIGSAAATAQASRALEA